jgi:hypothetical protein
MLTGAAQGVYKVMPKAFIWEVLALLGYGVGGVESEFLGGDCYRVDMQRVLVPLADG